MMRRQILSILCFLFCAASSMAVAATFHVDGSCKSDAGRGTAPGNCTGSAGTCKCTGDGPKKTISAGIALLTAPDDVLQIRGVRGGSAFHGRYSADRVLITKNGVPGHPYVIENHGYTGTYGSGEPVYIESTGLPGITRGEAILGWTQCPADCSACNGTVFPAVAGTCADIWWTRESAAGNPGGMPMVAGAQRPDGSSTAYRATAGALLNQYDHWNNGKQVPACSYAKDGSLSLFVRWGIGADAPGGANNPYPAVFFSDNGFGFQFGDDDGDPSASNFIVRGLNFRGVRRAHVQMTPLTKNIQLINNHFSYAVDFSGCESDRPITGSGVTGITISGNEFTCNRSEAIHTEAMAGAGTDTAYTITNNWAHDNGNALCPKMGDRSGGTPQVFTLGGGARGGGDYTGSVVSGNLINGAQVDALGAPGNARGITLENNSSNWIIRDNIIANIEGDCMRLEAQSDSGNAASKNHIYNNLFLNCNIGGDDSGGLNLKARTGCSASGNLVYNNTFINATLVTSDTSGTQADNIFRNNIWYKSGAWDPVVDWPSTDPGNLFENNLVWGPGIASLNAVNWLNISYTCSQINQGNMPGTDNNLCSDPIFLDVAGSDFHLKNGSPGKNTGTSAGMPASRTADACNTIASRHGFRSYADCQPVQGSIWDIGADEISADGPP